MTMVDVAQLVEPRIVIPAVAGSSPVVHPTSTVPPQPSPIRRPTKPLGVAPSRRSWATRVLAPIEFELVELTDGERIALATYEWSIHRLP